MIRVDLTRIVVESIRVASTSLIAILITRLLASCSFGAILVALLLTCSPVSTLARRGLRACLVGATGSCAQAFQLVDSFGDEGVRKGHLGRHTVVYLPFDTFLNKQEN